MDFLVRRQQLSTIKFSIKFDPDYGLLAPDEVLFELRRFGLSQTNIAYARHGDASGYWQLFPSERGWGALPCWGFAEIVRSRNAKVAEGELFYGCFPIAMRTVARLSSGPGRSVETLAPRRTVPRAFSRFRRTGDLACGDSHGEAMQMLFRPSFDRAVLIKDFLHSHKSFGARTIIVTAAESKTASCLAFLLTKQAPKHFGLIALTEDENRNLVRQQGSFDQILGYDELASLSRGRPTIVVDLADRTSVLVKLRSQLSGNIVCICRFGHGGGSSTRSSADANSATDFWTHSLLSIAQSETDPAADEAWDAFVDVARRSTELRRYSGYRAISQAYLDLLTGRSKSQSGYVLSW